VEDVRADVEGGPRQDDADEEKERLGHRDRRFAITTEGTLSWYETSRRSSQALNPSPISPITVTMLIASPTTRAPNKLVNGTPSRAKANRHPRVSTAMMSAYGTHTTTSLHQVRR